jgi:HK97 gp10 family phage protein
MARSSVRGGNKLRRALRRMPLEIRKEMGDVLEKGGRELSDMISASAPRDKGRLAAASHYKLGNDKLSVHVGYSGSRAGFKRKWKKGGFVALFKEFGTKKVPAVPFIRPNFRAKVPQIKAEMRKALNRMIARASTWKG